MSTVGYITRDMTGATRQGVFSDGAPAQIDLSGVKDISLNLTPAQIESYQRQGADLHVVLADGTVLVLDNFYSYSSAGEKNLFLSSDGTFVEVVLEDKAGGMLFASYEPLDLSGKWSAYDDMVFLNVDRVEPVVAPLAAPFLGGFGAAAAAGVAGTAVLLNGDDDPSGPPADTTAPTATIVTGTKSVGDLVNGVEHTAGPIITGTGEPGATLELTVNGVTRSTTIDEDGNWSLQFESTEINTGEYETEVTYVVTDEAGNSRSYTDILDVDTETSVTLDANQAGGDGVFNGVEVAGGVVLTGQAEAGATVQVTFENVTRTVVADSSGNWSASYTSTEVGVGERTSEVTVLSTDIHGNSATTSGMVEIDTYVNRLTVDPNQTADDVINRSEQLLGLTMRGTVEQDAQALDSTLTVRIGNVEHSAIIDAAGNWSVYFAPNEIPDGNGSSLQTATITATDGAGNVRTTTETFTVDTDFDSPSFVTVNKVIATGEVRDITIDGITDTYTVSALSGNDSTYTPGANISRNTQYGETEFSFVTPIPDGTNLVVTSQDTAGNASSTLLVLQDDASTANVLNHSGLSNFNLDTLDLGEAANASLTLSEADIKALSGNGDTLTVHGGNDDTLNLINAQSSGTRPVDGNVYNVYTLGDDTELLVDQSVNVLI